MVFEDVAHARSAVGEHHGRGLAGGHQLGQTVSRSVDHQVDVLFQRREAALLPETFLIDARGASEECLPRRDRENRRRETELLVGGFAQRCCSITLTSLRVAQVGLLQNEDDVLEPLLVHEIGAAPRQKRPTD